jgi:hypothetical protein
MAIRVKHKKVVFMEHGEVSENPRPVDTARAHPAAIPVTSGTRDNPVEARR